MNRRALAILIGWNLPWILFTAYALVVLAWSGPAGWSCPIDHVLGMCPGCGSTRAYADLLGGRAPGTWWIVPVLNGFAINAVWSVVKAARVGARTVPA